jgi:hypothetical protein
MDFIANGIQAAHAGRWRGDNLDRVDAELTAEAREAKVRAALAGEDPALGRMSEADAATYRALHHTEAAARLESRYQLMRPDGAIVIAATKEEAEQLSAAIDAKTLSFTEMARRELAAFRQVNMGGTVGVGPERIYSDAPEANNRQQGHHDTLILAFQPAPVPAVTRDINGAFIFDWAALRAMAEAQHIEAKTIMAAFEAGRQSAQAMAAFDRSDARKASIPPVGRRTGFRD